MSTVFVIIVISVGVPACLVRLWHIWWTSSCLDCGFERSACTCPPGEHMMRPRR